MRAIIVNCFDTYEDRINLVYNFLSSKGFDVKIIQSDFRHIKKIKRTDKKDNYIFVETKPYYKNLSLGRLNSHYNFAKSSFQLLKSIEPDLLYVTIPPNSLSKFAAKFKRENPSVKLIFDIIDLWPETIPMGNIKNIPPFKNWGNLRDKYLNVADYIITECNLYQDVLKDQLNGLETGTVHLAKSSEMIEKAPILSNTHIQLCYLGSINNIIDITLIKEIVNEINKKVPTTLHMIGDGESKELFINEILRTGAKVKYYGKVYDRRKKQKIFDECHFGLNIMKDSVCVGLTMKSIDYFQNGLPLLNNIKGDTYYLVDKYNTGYNVNYQNLEDISEKIIQLSTQELLGMRRNSYYVFENYFSIKTFNENMEKCLANIIKRD